MIKERKKGKKSLGMNSAIYIAERKKKTAETVSLLLYFFLILAFL